MDKEDYAKIIIDSEDYGNRAYMRGVHEGLIVASRIAEDLGFQLVGKKEFDDFYSFAEERKDILDEQA